MGCSTSKAAEVEELRDMLECRDFELDALVQRKNKEITALKWQEAALASVCTVVV